MFVRLMKCWSKEIRVIKKQFWKKVNDVQEGKKQVSEVILGAMESKDAVKRRWGLKGCK